VIPTDIDRGAPAVVRIERMIAAALANAQQAGAAV
jgi:hypothetical protein